MINKYAEAIVKNLGERVVEDKHLGMEKNAFVRYDKWAFSDYENEKGVPVIGTGIKIILERTSKWVDSGMGCLLGIIYDQTIRIESSGEIKYKEKQHRVWDADSDTFVEDKSFVRHYVKGRWEERLRDLGSQNLEK